MEPDKKQNFGQSSNLNQGDDNPPPAFGNQETTPKKTPKVDNFSPPKDSEGDSSAGSFAMPSDEELKKPETSSQEQSTQSIKPEVSEEEPEDVFAKTEAPPEPKTEAQPKPAIPPPPPTGGQKLDMPQEKKSYGCLWAIAAALTVILLGVIIAVNEFFGPGYSAMHLHAPAVDYLLEAEAGLIFAGGVKGFVLD